MRAAGRPIASPYRIASEGQSIIDSGAHPKRKSTLPAPIRNPVRESAAAKVATCLGTLMLICKHPELVHPLWASGNLQLTTPPLVSAVMVMNRTKAGRFLAISGVLWALIAFFWPLGSQPIIAAES